MSGSTMTVWSSIKDYDWFNLKLKLKKSTAPPYPPTVCDDISPPPCLPSLPALQPPPSRPASRVKSECAQGPGLRSLMQCRLSWAPLPARLTCHRSCSFVCFCSPHHALCLSPPRPVLPQAPAASILYNAWLVSHPCVQGTCPESRDGDHCSTGPRTMPSSPAAQVTE